MTPEVALELYKTYRSELMENLNLHRSTIEHYLAFTVAVLAAVVAGSTGLQQLPWLAPILAFAALLNCFICLVAARMCDRYYTGILDRIALVAKLEGYLTLADHATWLEMTTRYPGLPFREDVTLVPARWIHGPSGETTSAAFVRKGMGKGVNQLAKFTFALVVVINVIMAATLVGFHFGR